MDQLASALPSDLGIGKIHHVAVIVRDIDAALGLYRDKLGLPVEAVMNMDYDHVIIGFLPVGEVKIELVAPTDSTTGSARFLESKGEGFHHVCFEVADIQAALDKLAARGLALIDAAPRKGGEGPVAFVHPKSCHGVLVELIEAPGGPAWAKLGY
jgi:methylmalonyl-CoA/ethylmalonyl-CoA epimerase